MCKLHVERFAKFVEFGAINTYFIDHWNWDCARCTQKEKQLFDIKRTLIFDNQNICPLHCLNVHNGANEFMFGM